MNELYELITMSTRPLDINQTCQGVLDTTLCDQVCQSLVTGWWFFWGTSVSSTNKTDSHDISVILVKVV